MLFKEARHTSLHRRDEAQGDCWIGWIEEVPGVNCQERSNI
jgi:hypothetical protein